MNKICGYSCEHNKGGTCQLIVCDKHIYLNTTTTIDPEVFTRWQDTTIENKQQKEIERLNNIINEKDKKIDWLNNLIKIMENYLELIADLGYDYDGFNYPEDLKNLIDELVRYANLGRVYNTSEVIYINANKKYNILHEELKDSDKE